MFLSREAMLLIAVLCQSPDLPRIGPELILGISDVESSYNTKAINCANKNGKCDWGPLQINEVNFRILDVNGPSLIDQKPTIVHGQSVPSGACTSVRAAQRYWYLAASWHSRNPAIGIPYAAKVMARIKGYSDTSTSTPRKSSPPQQVDVIAVISKPAHSRRHTVVAGKE